METVIAIAIASVIGWGWLDTVRDKSSTRTSRVVFAFFILAAIVGATGVLGPTYAWFE